MAQLQISEAYKRDLLGQIQAHTEAKRAERTSYLEEGRKIRQTQQQEKAALEEVGSRDSGRTQAGAVVAHRVQNPFALD